MLLHFKDKKGISIAALSVAAIVIIALASVITVSLVGNFNDAKKIEFAQELNMIKIAVDNYYYENGSYPVSDKQLNISNLSQEVKQSQFYDETEIDGTYTLNVIDLNLINISNLKYGKGVDGLYDTYVVSNDTGNIYYAKGIKIGNETYYTLNKELSGLLTGNNKLEINSDNAVLFSESKLNNGKISVKISVPTNYEVNSVKFEDQEIELSSKGEAYNIYYVEASNKGTINVDYDYNQTPYNATYLIKDESNYNDDSSFKVNLIIKLSTEQPTQGPISASITTDNDIPYGYVIQYKVDDEEWTTGKKIDNISENCTIYSRIYNNDLQQTVAENKKNVTNIDKIAPTIVDVTGNSTEWINANVILTVNGAKDDETGLHSKETYSFDGGKTWQTSNSKLFEKNTLNIVIKVQDKAGNIYTHESLDIEYIDKTAPTITDVIGNPEQLTKDDVILTVNGAKDGESGLHETETYSFDNGITWQTENTKTYTTNTSNIIIKVKDKVGNIYTHDAINITKIDKSVPSIIDVTGNPTNWVNTDVTLKINGATDDSGLAEKPFSFDGGNTWQVSNTKTYTENTSNIIIKVKDNLGNVYTLEKIDIIYIDKTVPTIMGVTGNSAVWTNSDITLVINDAQDNLSGLHETESYSFDGGTTWQVSNTKTYTENTSNIIIKVKDKAGNIYTHEAINIEYIDKEAPTIDEIAGNLTYWSKWDVSLNVNNAKDKESGLAEKPYSFDGGISWQNENYKIYSQNTSNIVIKVRDKVGNVYTHDTIDIEYLDKQAPSKPTGISVIPTLNSLTVQASGSADTESGLAGYQYSLDNQNWTNTIKEGETYTFDSIKSNTEATIYAKAIDNVGWESSVYGPVNATTSTITNKVTITLSEEDWTKGPITADLSYDNIPTGYVIQYKIGTGNWTSGTKTTDITENTTVHGRLYNENLEDEIAYNSKSIAYIDNEEPSIIDISGNPTDYVNTNVTLTINGASDTQSGLHETEAYSFDNGTTWQISNTKIYTENTSNIVIKVKDKVGNIYAHDVINITYIDKDAPSITSVTGNPTTWTKNDVTLTVNGASDDKSGLHSTETYSFDGGSTWQTNNTKVYTENTSGIVIKVKDKLGNIYTHETINITYIDKLAPSKPTGIDITPNLNSLTVKTSGSTDTESGLAGYKYSLDNNNWSDLIADGTTYTFENIKAGTEVTIYTKAIDKLGWESSVYGPVNSATSTVANKVTITLSEEDWTKGPITADLSYDNIPEGYVIQYKIGTQSWITGTKITDISENIIIYGRLYNEELEDEIATNTKSVSKIDNESPTDPTDIEIVTRELESITVKGLGSTDSGVGLLGYQYSLNGTSWSDIIDDEASHTISSLSTNNTYTIYVRAIDKLGNVSQNNYQKTTSTLSSYSVTYNKNTTETVSTMPENQTKVEDVTLTLSLNNPTRAGYTFKGWATSETSTEVAYNPGDGYIANSAVTLYAIWELNAPVVTITAQNTDINLFDNVTTTFTANVGNTKNQTYQWYYNDNAIDGATSATYSIATTNMTSNNYNGGTYKVVVTNASGSANSAQTQTVAKTISTAEQMKNFANRVNNQSITFLNDTVTQTADIDLSTVCSATLGNWTPIGDFATNTSLYFAGIYNGNGKTIDNLYINNSSANNQALFGAISNSNINNLTVTGTVIGNLAVGGIIGDNYNGGRIENCTNKVNVTGVVGVGGIIGRTMGVSDSNNVITGSTIISNCYNYGKIYSDKADPNSKYIGGIVGVGQSHTIQNCINYASIEGNIYVAGISGISNASNTNIQNCSNEGEISFINTGGGILGSISGKVENCQNNGNIYGNVAGGITGGTNATTTIKDCINNAFVEGNNIGGIVYRNYGKISNCKNNANITINIPSTEKSHVLLGGIATYNYGTIEKCGNIGAITARTGVSNGLIRIGGIVGMDSVGAITKMCYNSGNIIADNQNNDTSIMSTTQAGGILGITQGSVIDCYNLGDVSINKKVGGNTSTVGGISGDNTVDSTIINCYNIGKITATREDNINSLIHISAIAPGNTVTNTYYLEGIALGGIDGADIADKAEKRSAEYMKTSYFVDDLGNDNWKIVSGVNNGYPILEWQDGTEISVDFITVSTAQALKDFAMIVNEKGQTFEGKTVTQLADIDLSTVCSATLGSWTPIGDYNSNTNLYFAGTYNGNNKNISNLYINDNTKIDQGLFGGTNKANIKNIVIVNPYVVANTRVAALVGLAFSNTAISNVYINGGTIYGLIHVGSMIGRNNSSLISMCSNSATVGTYMTTEVTEEAGGFGGLVGCNSGGIIEKSVNYGTVEGFKYLGGICGINWGVINDCYNVGIIKPTVNTYKYFIGGIVGTQNGNNTEYKIENCYNIGNIINNNDVYYYGGVVGTTDCILTNNYYLEGIAPGGVNGADIAGQAEVRSAEYMKTSYFVDDLGNDNWKKVAGANSGYPILEWQEGTEIEIRHSTINGKTATYSNPIIPMGFTTLETASATWKDNNNDGNPDGWNEGLVILDGNNNEYVWIPVDGTNVKYSKWDSSKSSDYTVTKDQVKDDALPSGVTSEASQVQKYGGFYVARYEASLPDAQTTEALMATKTFSASDNNRTDIGKAQSKANKIVWNRISYTNAKTVSENVISNGLVYSGLITGTQWDTMLDFLSQEVDVDTTSTAWGNYYEKIRIYNKWIL